MRRDLLVYVSGKYTDETTDKVRENILVAREYALAIWELGFTAICPHLNTAHFEESKVLGYDDYIEGDLAMLERCDGIYMLPNWKDSNGAKIELEYAVSEKLPVFHNLRTLDMWQRNKKSNLYTKTIQ